MVSFTYSFAQLEALWEEAGGPGAVAPIMAAIALAESGGNPFSVVSDPTAHDPSATANGLWQINTGSDANPQFRSWQLTDPMQNAMAAVAVWKSQGFGAWTTYTSGAYTAFLQGSAPSFVGYTPGSPTISSTDFSPQARNVGIVFIAAVLVILGLSATRPSSS